MDKKLLLIPLFFIFYLLFKKRNMRLSKNFTLQEFQESDTARKYGIINLIPQKYVPNIQKLVDNVLQPARDWVNMTVIITSGYRSQKLIEALKKEGYNVSPNTQHAYGMAADLTCNDNAKLFNFIKDNLFFDQLIWEGGDDTQPEWVHVSYRDGKNRNQVLKIQ